MLKSTAPWQADSELPAKEPPEDPSKHKMFTIEARQDHERRIIVVGKSSRKRATTLINIPISEGLKSRLSERVVGSLSMATAALLQWAFDELDRKAVSIEVRPRQ